MEIFKVKWILIFFAIFASSGFAKAAPELRGLRVDPSYFYDLYPESTAEDIAHNIVANALDAHVNMIYLYAYNSVNGAFYDTDYPMTQVEPHLGLAHIFAAIYNEARAHSIDVVACISVTDYKLVWEAHPDWRSKLINGADYKPFSHAFLLSAWHPGYRDWFKGFVSDIAERFPELYAIEAIEPTVDCFWLNEADYNPIANQEFWNRYPAGKLGDADWKKVRALGASELLGLLAEVAHSKNIKAGVVQTWPARPNGHLFTSDEVRDRIGFNLNEILNLQGAQKFDFVIGEFLWQQWSAEYGNPVFTPAWTSGVAQEFIKFVDNRSQPIIHVEISPWHGKNSVVTPTVQEFYETLRSIKDLVAAIDVYDHSQIQARNAWQALSVWNE